MEIKIVKKGFNYSQDGPGNRLVYHLAGCNMKCPWCANPEAMSLNCECESYPIEKIADEAVSCSPIFFDGGGVTLSGGEPTVQIGAARELLKLLKERGIDTAIESNGTNPQFDTLFPYLDSVIMDFKHYDDEIHKKFTGISNVQIKRNIEKAAKSCKLLIRTPLINGFNADKKDVDGFIRFYRTIDCENVKFELLKYHEYGKVKWEKLGLKYSVENGAVTDELVKYFEDEYRKNGLKVIRT